MVESSQVGARLCGDGRVVDGAGEDAGGESHPLVEFLLYLEELMLDGVLQSGGEGGVLQEVLNEEAVTAMGGHASGGGMGMGKVAQFFQNSHLVADGGGGDAQFVFLDQHARPHRFGVLDEFLDHQAQDEALARSQVRKDDWFSRHRSVLALL